MVFFLLMFVKGATDLCSCFWKTLSGLFGKPLSGGGAENVNEAFQLLGRLWTCSWRQEKPQTGAARNFISDGLGQGTSKVEGAAVMRDAPGGTVARRHCWQPL